VSLPSALTSVITGNTTGVRVNGGTALIQKTNLGSNTSVGLQVLNNGVVDAGQTTSHTTELAAGLGVSSGGNDFSSYTATGAKAIRNENAYNSQTLTFPPDVMAENNLFYSTAPANIENVVDHHTDTSGYAYVDYSPPASTLEAAAGAKLTEPATAGLNLAQLQPLVAAAMERWARAGAGVWFLRQMSEATFVICDLPGGYLGLTDQNTVYLDWNAAGYGWYVDATPRKDEEFRSGRSRGELRAVDPRAVDRMDLLTVLEHELGHIAGLDDLWSANAGLMQSTLDVGLRRFPVRADLNPLRQPQPAASAPAGVAAVRVAPDQAAVDRVLANDADDPWKLRDHRFPAVGGSGK
jgi:hypothetical protein